MVHLAVACSGQLACLTVASPVVCVVCVWGQGGFAQFVKEKEQELLAEGIDKENLTAEVSTQCVAMRQYPQGSMWSGTC